VTSVKIVTVSSVASVQNAYKRSERSDKVSSGAVTSVTSQPEAGGVSPVEGLVPRSRFQSDIRRNSKKTS
jgi:hypothetical protein